MPLNFLPPVCQNHNTCLTGCFEDQREYHKSPCECTSQSESLLLDSASPVPSPLYRASVEFSSVSLLYLTLCDPIDYSTPGFRSFTISQSLLKLVSIQTRWCHPTISSCVTPFSSCLHSLLASGSFPMTWLFSSGDQNFSFNISPSSEYSGLFPLGLAGFISLSPVEFKNQK